MLLSRVRCSALLVSGCILVPAVPAGAQSLATFRDAREYLSSCTYEVSIREAPDGQSTYVFTDRSTGGFVQAGGAVATIVAAGFRVSGPRIVTEGQIPDGLYNVVVCGEEGREAALRAALRQGIGVDITAAVRMTDVLVMRVAPDGPAPGLALASSDEVSAFRVMRGSVEARNTPLSGIIGFLENVLGVPVVDESALDAGYSFSLSFDRSDPESLRRALANELGLVLEPDRRELTVTLIRPR